MHRYVASTVASQRAMRRCVTTSVAASPRRFVGRRNVPPFQAAAAHISSRSSRQRDIRHRYGYKPDDDNNDNGYLRPNKVANFSQVKGDSGRNHLNKFKSSYHGSNQFRKSWLNKTNLIREQLSGEFSHRNERVFGNNFRQRNPSHGNSNFRKSSLVLRESFTGLYSIQIPDVEDYDEVIKIIQNYITPIQFNPYNIHVFNNTNTLVFIVDDFKTAKILQNISGKIPLLNQKLIIRVKPYTPRVLHVSVPSEIREKMAHEIANRYNPNTKCLDLSHFHSSQSFIEVQLFLSLNQPSYLMATLKIAADYVKHDLYGLSLKKNLIFLGDELVWIRRLFPGLKVLDLSDNKLVNLKSLKRLSGFTIEELDLSMNPVYNSVDKEHFKRKVQEIFPVLKKLDNFELESRYSVDLQLKMPINLGNSYPILEGYDPKKPNPVTTFVELFLTQYFERYDNEVSRQLVSEAYFENSVFTLSSDNLRLSNGNLSEYITKSRNLLNSTLNNNGNQLVHRGRQNIVNFFDKLPKTRHDLGSFQIDVPLANSTMVQIVVNGVFAENFEESNIKHVFRSFCRSFCIVPNGTSWHLLSDMLFVSLVSNELMIESLKRFNASKSSKKNNFNGNKMNNMTMFLEDERKMRNLASSSSTNYPTISTLQNQQLNSQPHVTLSTAMIFSLKQKKPNTSSTPVLNMTQSSSPTKSISSPIILSSPSSPIDITSSAAMNFQREQQNPKVMPNTLLNMIQPPKLATSLTLSTSSPSSPTLTNHDKLTMIKNFSNATGMNDQWTKKCLEENDWDYYKASFSFSRLKSSVPSVAYIR